MYYTLPMCVMQIICCLLELAPSLLSIDESTEMVITPLQVYPNLVLGPTADASMRVDDSKRLIVFSQEAVIKIVETCWRKHLSKQHLPTAVATFLLHEIIHHSQRLKKYGDVKRIKEVGERDGQEQMAEWDLQADFLATHTLSLLNTKIQNQEYNERIYIRHFYENWCVVCRAMLGKLGNAPSLSRKDKLQRYFGYLLMAHLMTEARLENRPRPFNGELFPKWNEQLNWLTIKSNGYIWYPGGAVDPVIMRQIMDNISSGNWNSAEAGIAQVWCQLPRG